MVGVSKRSLSFPNKNPHRPLKPPVSHHLRSVSLPCRSHPLISHLTDEINQLKIWSSKPSNRTSGWLCDGLNRLKDVYDSLDEILQLPQAQETLRRRPQWVENLLEDLLRFVDVYGLFHTAVLTLREEQLSAQVAIRKRNDSNVSLFVKSCKKTAKEMAKLACMVRGSELAKSTSDSVSAPDAELMGLIGGVIELTVSVSVSLFCGISTSFSTRRSSSWVGLLRLIRKAHNEDHKVDEGIQEFTRIGGDGLQGLKNKGDEQVRMVLERFREMEECLGSLEKSGQDVFRSLIKSRVSLLNSFIW